MKVVPVNTKAFFQRAVGVAEHYGFRNVDDLALHAKEKRGPALGFLEHQSPDEQIDRHVLPNVLAHYASTVELRKRQALMFYTPSLVTHRSARGVRVSALSLNSVGVEDALSEIILIKTAASIADELGIKRYMVRVNSIGDNDSSARFVRDVSQHLRSKLNELPDEMADTYRKSPSAAIAGLYQMRHPIIADLPSPLDFLTAPSRKHFKDLLELLEYAEIPFELDDRLYGDHTMYSHTLYELVETNDEGDEEVLARGGRYDALTKAYSRGAIPAAGMVVAAHTKDQGTDLGRPRRRKPNACLIHIGREARIKSISIVETFRREHIPIDQCLHFERFSEQIAYAERQQTKYIIILGQREAHDGVAIVRNSADRSQHTIPIHGLAKYVKDVTSL